MSWLDMNGDGQVTRQGEGSTCSNILEMFL